ncbi:hypothetical protein BP5796_05518 [Coleophoma crateriformis]|uniref:Uncharacterized protein n=1 Tax=Coleophoma crateriformis TaxID=565419 RepID=A0A3D8S3S3_9HELO|nr:hypothetical protein BP5796_05518 [Coleophoma crateriformis]
MALMLVQDPSFAVDGKHGIFHSPFLRSTALYGVPAECFRMCKSGRSYSISTRLYEAWNAEVQHAISTLPNALAWLKTSDELIIAWVTGAWHIPWYCKDMLTAAGFVGIKVELLSVHMPMHHAKDSVDIYEAFIEMVTDEYWTAREQKARCRPLIREAALRTCNAEYGKESHSRRRESISWSQAGSHDETNKLVV